MAEGLRAHETRPDQLRGMDRYVGVCERPTEKSLSYVRSIYIKHLADIHNTRDMRIKLKLNENLNFSTHIFSPLLNSTHIFLFLVYSSHFIKLFYMLLNSIQ